MSLWDSFAQSFRNPSKRYLTPELRPEQVDIAYDSAPIQDGGAYCRIWLVEMRLAHGTNWFKTRYPALYAATKYQYGKTTVTVPYVGGLDFFKDLTQDNLDRVIQLNRSLTPLFPFNGGMVDFQAGLFGMQAGDPIGRFLGVMGRLANLLPVPELSSVLPLVDPIYKGIEELFQAGQSQFELGYQQAWTGASGGGSNVLRQQYFAAILAQEHEVDWRTLRVVNDSLRILIGGVGSRPQPVSGFSYLLFRIEKRTAQDWESLANISELVERAQAALDMKQLSVAKDLEASIKIAIARSPDVAKADREGMFSRIQAHLRELGLQAAPGEVARQSLYSIMQRPAAELEAQTKAEMDIVSRMFVVE